jgi:hypothetical protein
MTFMPACLTPPSVGTCIKRPFHSSWKRFVYTSPTVRCLTLPRDGSDLFQLSRTYNVHISVKRNPLAIYLEGTRESIRAAQECVDVVRKARYCFCVPVFVILIGWQSIVEDIVDTPFAHPVSQEVLQRVSRLSGAFVENIGDQKVRTSLSLGVQSNSLVEVTRPSQASHAYHVSSETSSQTTLRSIFDILLPGPF